MNALVHEHSHTKCRSTQLPGVFTVFQVMVAGQTSMHNVADGSFTLCLTVLKFQITLLPCLVPLTQFLVEIVYCYRPGLFRVDLCIYTEESLSSRCGVGNVFWEGSGGIARPHVEHMPSLAEQGAAALMLRGMGRKESDISARKQVICLSTCNST